MTRINLTGGAYQSRALIASAQRQLNLYSEPLPRDEGEPAPVANYLTPGLSLLCTLPTMPVRGIRSATNGRVYAVGGASVYVLDAAWTPTLLGTIAENLTTPVSMTDNGIELVIVDGSSNGWKITIADNTFAPIVDTTGSFRGGDRVDYLDTFFLFNVPGTPQFESSLSLSTTFDPLYFANKSAYSDLLVAMIVIKREIWLIGDRTTEIWYNTGAAAFPFESMPGAFIDHGCVAKYSAAEVDNGVFWLSQDRQGAGIVLKGDGYKASRISTFAIEAEISRYSVITDAVGWPYQVGGHTCYVLTFPTADKTWAFDLSTEQWHEWSWLDGDGVEHRHRGNCAFQAHGLVAVGDWQNGNIYALDPNVRTDAGAPIKRQRSFPHMVDGGKRVFYRQFVADMQAGTTTSTEPFVYLDWSDDRGASFGNPIAQGFGASGEYRTSLQFQRLGMARDRVFRLTWSTDNDTALLGAWIDTMPALS